MIRPSLLAVWVFIIGAVFAALITAAIPDAWTFALMIGPALIGLLVIDALLTPGRRAAQFEINMPEVMYLGDDEGKRLNLIIDPAGRSLGTVELLADTNDLFEPLKPMRLNVEAGQAARVSLPLRALRRGLGAVPRLWLRWSGPLGLVRRVLVLPNDRTVRIVPDVRAARRAAIEFYSKDAFFGVKVDRDRGDGSEFEALREFVHGDDQRAIDWKQSARHRNILVKDFRTERNHQVVIAFDVGHLMAEPQDGLPRLDHAINAGLLLGLLAVLSEDQVGMYAFDTRARHFLRPAPGMRAFTHLQMATADLDYGTEETNFTLGMSELQSRLQRRSLVVLFTEFVDSVTSELMVENLRRMAQRHQVIFVTLKDPYLTETIDKPVRSAGDIARSVVASGMRDDRQVVRERLERLGIHCIEARADEIGPAVLNRYLHIKSRELI